MSYQNNVITNFAIALSETSGFDKCFELLKCSVQKLGFDGVLYMSSPLGFSSSNKEKALSIFQASDAYSLSFLEHYAQANFVEHDYTVKFTLAGKMELVDWWEKEHEGILSKEELNVFSVAREDYNMRNGLSIPTLCTPHEISGASVICCDRDQVYSQLVKNNAQYVKALIKIFHNRIQADMDCKKVFIIPFFDKIGIKERQLLKFLATGLPMKALDSHYDISAGYAKNLLPKICEKLGIKNVHELRYFLGVYRVIDML